MGVSIYYRAIPSSSNLLRSLQRDEAFFTLTAALFHYGHGIFYFFNEIDPDEREEILESVIKTRQDRLGAEPEARRLIDELRRELEQTRLAYPGVEERRYTLDTTSRLIRERLTIALEDNRTDPIKTVNWLMYGNEMHGRDEARELDDKIYLVSATHVQEGAQLLSQVDEFHVFASDQDWLIESFQRWRRLYQESAAEGDAILVGVF